MVLEHNRTIPCRPTRPDTAFTLSEVLVALAASSVILGAVLAFTVFTGKSFVGLTNYMDLEYRSREALDIMTRDIRGCRAMTQYASNRIVLADANGQPLTIEWDPNTKVVTRTAGGQTKVLLTGCDFLLFRIYQRNPIPGRYDFYPATNLAGQYDPALCKLVDITWRCSRQMLGKKLHTESILTAKIVLRN